MPGRRLINNVPQLVRRAWSDAAPELERFLTRLWDSNANGLPAGVTSVTPTTITPGATGSVGTPTSGWEPGDHTHPIATGAPSGLANAAAEGTSTAFPRLDHKHKRDVRVKAEGSDVGTRNALDVKDTTTIDAVVTDNAGADTVELTFNAKPFVPALTTKTGNYTVLAGDSVILVDASGGDVEITLPAGTAGRLVQVKKIDSTAGTVTITPDGSETIEGDVDFVLTVFGESVPLVSDGSDWWVL